MLYNFIFLEVRNMRTRERIFHNRRGVQRRVRHIARLTLSIKYRNTPRNVRTTVGLFFKHEAVSWQRVMGSHADTRPFLKSEK